MWKLLRGKQNLLLILLGAGLVISCLVYFVLAPQVRAFAQVKEELAGARASLSAARSSAASMTNERDRLEKTKEEYSIKCGPFDQCLRDGSDIIFLGTTAASGNIVAAEIIPEDIIEKPHTLERPVKIAVQGDYGSIAKFCRKIDTENPANITEIRSLSIETKSLSNGVKSTVSQLNPETIKATLWVVMFSLKDPAGSLSPDELSKTLTGRSNIFRPAAPVTP
jgi:Tfp pilus assembly protein PilO